MINWKLIAKLKTENFNYMKNRNKVINIPNILVLIAILTVLVNLLFPFSAAVHIETVVGFVALYVSFSLWHHYWDKSLTVELTLEYILIAAMVLTIVVSLQR